MASLAGLAAGVRIIRHIRVYLARPCTTITIHDQDKETGISIHKVLFVFPFHSFLFRQMSTSGKVRASDVRTGTSVSAKRGVISW